MAIPRHMESLWQQHHQAERRLRGKQLAELLEERSEDLAFHADASNSAANYQVRSPHYSDLPFKMLYYEAELDCSSHV